MQPLTGFGVAKVLDSRHPNFKKGDLIWNPDGKNIVSLQNWQDSLKSSTLMSPFPTILEFLVFCCLCVCVWGLDIYVLACEIPIRMRLLYALYM